MALLLDAAYLGALAAASPWIAYKMAASARWRAGFKERLGMGPSRDGESPCIWLHAASVGEVLAARSLLVALGRALPGYEIVVSTTTVEGRRTAEKHFRTSPFYFPLDVTACVKAAVRRLRPDLILLVEREVWPNFIAVADRASVPVMVVNGMVSERFVRRFSLLKSLGLSTLSRIDCFAVQNETYRGRLLSLGIDERRVQVTGSMKYDNLPEGTNGAAQEAMATVLKTSQDDWLFVAGSTRETEEEAIIVAFVNALGRRPGCRLILVPRHVDRKEEIARTVRKYGLDPVFKTALGGQNPPEIGSNTVVIVDTFGELETLYSIASAVFVGGTLTPESGGHNFLEPAAFSRPIVIGSHVRNFQEAADSFLAKRALFMVDCPELLVDAVRTLAEDPVSAAAMGERAARIVKENRGATDRTVALVRSLLGK